nr:alpha/beta hydrolase [Spelaeicoccus albus]
MRLDVYRPETSANVPAVVWLHGGGWFTGDRTLAPDLAVRVRATGCALATVDYRLSGEAIFPAQLHDVRAAIRFLRGSAAELGLDAERVGLWGASAGGHLAALAALTGRVTQLPGEPDAGDASVRAVAESYAPVDLAGVVAAAEARLPGADGASTPEARLLGGHPTGRPELAAQASPLNWIGTARQGSPAFQISHGTGDVLVPCEQSKKFHEALVAAGYDSELFLVDDYRHGFLNPAGRMDVNVRAVMDDGRLAAAGKAPASRVVGAGNSFRGTFGFADIDTFFARQLSTIAPARDSGSPSGEKS